MIHTLPSNVITRQQIVNFEASLAQHARAFSPDDGMPPVHYFAQGVCGREIVIPAGVALAGRIHKQSQINVVSGLIEIASEQGRKLIDARARPEIICTPAGTKRVGWAQTDTVWITFLGTDLTDPDEIYTTLTAATYEEYQLFCNEQFKIEGKT